MAINQFLGTATAVAQVDTYTPINVLVGNVFTLTMTGFDGSTQSVSYTAGAATADDVTAGLTSVWNTNAEGNTLIGSLTAADLTGTMTLTADTPGTAFKVLGTATGGTADITEVNTTANAGPNAWDDANNWSEGTIPGDTASEETVVENSSVDILYGLDQSGASETLTSLTIKQTYTGKIGWNEAAGEVGDYLQVEVTDLYIGQNFDNTSASGSGRIKIDLGTVQSSVIVYNTGNSSDNNKPAFRMICANASTIIREIRKGSVGLAFLSGETSTIGSVLLSFASSKSNDASISIGGGTTLTTYEQIGGTGTVKCPLTTATAEAGTLLLTDGAITTLNVDGASVTPVTPDTITTCNVISGTCDFTASAVPRTVTTLKLASGATLKIDIWDGVSSGVVTLTNNIEAFESGRVQYRTSGV